MKTLWLSLVFILLCSCTTTTTTVPTVPVQTPAPTTQSVDDLINLAGTSVCAKHSWQGRGVAPVGYTKGMAVMYAKSLCHPDPVASKKELGPSNKDVLAYFGLEEGSNYQTYAVLLGLGMRESSGAHCTGRDMSASNATGSTSEAGLFQASYDSIGADPELTAIYNKYKADQSKCYLSVFDEGVTCPQSDWKNWGTGEGVTFQSLEKKLSCFFC